MPEVEALAVELVTGDGVAVCVTTTVTGAATVGADVEVEEVNLVEVELVDLEEVVEAVDEVAAGALELSCCVPEACAN